MISLERTTVERRGILLIPPAEKFGNPYWLCAGASDSTLTLVYDGHGSLSPTSRADFLMCIEWTWEGRDRMTCSVRGEGSIVSGGRWTDGAAHGWFRVYRTAELRRMSGYDRPVKGVAVYVQWIEESGSVPPFPVRAIVRVPFDSKVNHIQRMEVAQAIDRTYLHLTGTRSTFMDSYAPMRRTFELRRPGVICCEERYDY